MKAKTHDERPVPKAARNAAMSSNAPTILIMAGQRLGKIDQLAAKHGQAHKCLVPLLGRPLIGYVFDAVDAAFPGARIIVSIDDPHALDDMAQAQALFEAGRLCTVASAPDLLDSALAAVASANPSYPLLITTGDNVLMTAQALRDFHTHALERGADGAVMCARKEAVLAAHSDGQPRFWKFRDGEFSGCNTFWWRDASALVIGTIFRGGGQFLKFPGRFINAFGLANLIGFRLGLLTLDRMVARVSRRCGKEIRMQVVDNGELSIDVDDEFSHQVAERLLTRRSVAGSAADQAGSPA